MTKMLRMTETPAIRRRRRRLNWKRKPLHCSIWSEQWPFQFQFIMSILISVPILQQFWALGELQRSRRQRYHRIKRIAIARAGMEFMQSVAQCTLSVNKRPGISNISSSRSGSTAFSSERSSGPSFEGLIIVPNCCGENDNEIHESGKHAV